METSTQPHESAPNKARGRLDRESIVETGLSLAARPGTKTISVRELGQLLRADPTAIYRHFRNKDEVMLALLDALEVRAVGTVTAPRADWQERLRQLSDATLSEFIAHPAVGVHSIVATTHGPGEKAAVELILDAFAQAGLDEEGVVTYYALFAQHMMASASGIARSASESDEPSEVGTWFDSTPTADPVSHPLLARMAHRLGHLRDVDLFRAGVQIILDAAERLGAEQSAKPAGA